MNLDYLKPGATIPITAEAIRYLVDVAKQLQAENNFLKVWRDTWAPHINPLKQTKLQEWQYLTDEEIKEIVGSYGTGAGGYGNGVGGNNLGGYTRELFNKIEEKIREKNDV